MGDQKESSSITTDLINSMQVQVNNGDSSETGLECPICTELFISAMTLSCSHTFCKYCIAEWRKDHVECPVCREIIKQQTPTLIIDNFVNKVVEKSDAEDRLNREQIRAERERLMEAMPPPASNNTENYYYDENGDLYDDYQMSLSDEMSLTDYETDSESVNMAPEEWLIPDATLPEHTPVEDDLFQDSISTENESSVSIPLSDQSTMDGLEDEEQEGEEDGEEEDRGEGDQEEEQERGEGDQEEEEDQGEEEELGEDELLDFDTGCSSSDYSYQSNDYWSNEDWE